MIKKFNENFEESFEEDNSDIEEFKPILTEKEPLHYISSSDMIGFIEKNSDMHWNQVCRYIYDEGILHHDGPDFYENSILDNPNMYNDLVNKWIGGFFKVHPWIKQMMVVFDD